MKKIKIFLYIIFFKTLPKTHVILQNIKSVANKIMTKVDMQDLENYLTLIHFMKFNNPSTEKEDVKKYILDMA
jgi:hypothetical protein